MVVEPPVVIVSLPPAVTSLTKLSASAIAGMASSTAHVKKRSVILPLSQVRIFTCLPSQFPYTPGSLCPFLSLSSLFIGSEFHGFGRLLRCSKYRLSGREGRTHCQVANLWRIRICQVAIFWGSSYTPGRTLRGLRKVWTGRSVALWQATDG